MSSERNWFWPPVTVATENVGRPFGVNSVELAGQHLLKWERRGPKWRIAVETCMGAMEGKNTPDEVREAFRSGSDVKSMREARLHHVDGVVFDHVELCIENQLPVRAHLQSGLRDKTVDGKPSMNHVAAVLRDFKFDMAVMPMIEPNPRTLRRITGISQLGQAKLENGLHF
jgi:hypothetical protein